MTEIPKTSVSLINAIRASHESPRWFEFYGRYHEIMASFIQKRFSTLEVDEIVQEAMIAFMKKIPDYKYDPDTNGYFHNYLLGIVKYKAYEALRRRKRDSEICKDLKEEIESSDQVDPSAQAEGFYKSLDASSPEESRTAILAIAIRRYLDDSSVKMMYREVFRRTTCEGESPEVVADDFGITRNHVDQINSRARKRIGAIADGLRDLKE